MNKGKEQKEENEYIYIDDQKFKIYELDTTESIKNRIAKGDFYIIFNGQNFKMPAQLPKLIILQETILSDKETLIQLKNLECKTLMFETKSGNQLAGRRFILLDFVRSTLIGILNAYAKPDNLEIDIKQGLVSWDNHHIKFYTTEYQRELIKSGGSVGVMINLAAELQKEGKL